MSKYTKALHGRLLDMRIMHRCAFGEQGFQICDVIGIVCVGQTTCRRDNLYFGVDTVRELATVKWKGELTIASAVIATS